MVILLPFSYHLWDDAVQRLAVLDVLLSLAYYSSHGDGTMSRPELILPEDNDLKNGVRGMYFTSFISASKTL